MSNTATKRRVCVIKRDDRVVERITGDLHLVTEKIVHARRERYSYPLPGIIITSELCVDLDSDGQMREISSARRVKIAPAYYVVLAGTVLGTILSLI